MSNIHLQASKEPVKKPLPVDAALFGAPRKAAWRNGGMEEWRNGIESEEGFWMSGRSCQHGLPWTVFGGYPLQQFSILQSSNTPVLRVKEPKYEKPASLTLPQRGDFLS
jgi:hypothetical protein